MSDHPLHIADNPRLAASVFMHSREGLLILDPQGRICDANPAFTRITGYSPAELAGRPLETLASGHQDFAFYAELWRTLETSGNWHGELWLRKKNGRIRIELLSLATARDDQGKVSHYVGSILEITHLQAQQGELDRLAHYDPLTGLPNRCLLGERLLQGIRQTRQSGKIMAVGVLRVEQLRDINQHHGYQNGDQVLLAVAQRLTAELGEGNTIARIGGDKFALLLPNLRWVEECDAILTRVLGRLADPVALEGGPTLSPRSSIGLALFPQDNGEAESLLRLAESAMQRAGAQGGHRYLLSSAEHDHLLREHHRLLEDLHDGLDRSQFVFLYQPRVELATGRVTGIEALIRWRHPERGLLSPAQFIYATADSALEIALGDWVLATNLRQLAAWRAQGIMLPLGMNLTIGHFLHPDFPASLARTLARHPEVAPESIEIEISESVTLADTGRVASAITACTALGVRVLLDDFSSGQAPLSYFWSLPVHALKIDVQFIRDLEDVAEHQAAVEGIIRISRAFGREVIALGVETIERGIFLLHLGCQQAQGFAIARPIPADQLPGWLAQWTGVPAWQTMAGLQLAREDLALAAAEDTHRAWLGEVCEQLRNSLLPVALPTRSRLAQWLNGKGRERHGQREEFRNIATAYARFHALLEELIAGHAALPGSSASRVDELLVSYQDMLDATNILIATLQFEMQSGN